MKKTVKCDFNTFLITSSYTDLNLEEIHFLLSSHIFCLIHFFKIFLSCWIYHCHCFIFIKHFYWVTTKGWTLDCLEFPPPDELVFQLEFSCTQILKAWADLDKIFAIMEHSRLLVQYPKEFYSQHNRNHSNLAFIVTFLVIFWGSELWLEPPLRLCLRHCSTFVVHISKPLWTSCKPVPNVPCTNGQV